MLTARDELDDKLAGFGAGADDYLVKPFAMPELAARLEALIRRTRGGGTRHEYRVGDLVLNQHTARVTRSGQSLHLSRTQFAILHILMRESPKLVHRGTMERLLWGDDLPDSDALRSHLYALRRIVDRPFTRALIETVPGHGFRIAP